MSVGTAVFAVSGAPVALSWIATSLPTWTAAYAGVVGDSGSYATYPTTMKSQFVSHGWMSPFMGLQKWYQQADSSTILSAIGAKTSMMEASSNLFAHSAAALRPVDHHLGENFRTPDPSPMYIAAFGMGIAGLVTLFAVGGLVYALKKALERTGNRFEAAQGSMPSMWHSVHPSEHPKIIVAEGADVEVEKGPDGTLHIRPSQRPPAGLASESATEAVIPAAPGVPDDLK